MTEDGGEPIEPIMPDSDMGISEETSDAVPEPVLEMPDPEPGTDSHTRIGVLDDDSDEHPIVPDASVPITSRLQQAFECLQIKTPIEEFQTYAGSRLEAMVRLGEPERAEVTSRALELGVKALRQVMGAAPPEAP